MNKDRTLKNYRIPTKSRRIQPGKFNALLYNQSVCTTLKELLIRPEKPGSCSLKRMANLYTRKMNHLKTFKETIIEENNAQGLREWFLKTTSNVIKHELDRHLRENNFEDDVWTIACDKLKNYKEYFVSNNPCNLYSTSLKTSGKDNKKSKLLSIGSYISGGISDMLDEHYDEIDDYFEESC
jgi:hypothetical protein